MPVDVEPVYRVDDGRKWIAGYVVVTWAYAPAMRQFVERALSSPFERASEAESARKRVLQELGQ